MQRHSTWPGRLATAGPIFALISHTLFIQTLQQAISFPYSFYIHSSVGAGLAGIVVTEPVTWLSIICAAMPFHTHQLS